MRVRLPYQRFRDSQPTAPCRLDCGPASSSAKQERDIDPSTAMNSGALFCIRDDDTSFFTTPEKLEAAYGEITQAGPVSLAVVPFCIASTNQMIPEPYRGRWSVHALHENKSLVDYLRAGIREGRYEAMLHGYHHDEKSGRWEFARGKHLTQRVHEGRKYLEDLLQTEISVFVAPNNVIGGAGLRAISRSHMNLAGLAGVRTGWPLISARTWKIWLQLRKLRRQGSPAIPWILDLGGHRELSCQTVTPYSDPVKIRRVCDRAAAIGGVFCLAAHYWEFAAPSVHQGFPSVGEQMMEIISHARHCSSFRWTSVGDALATGRRLFREGARS